MRTPSSPDDHGYAEQFEKQTGKKADWFTTNGDVFPVGTAKLTPFEPVSPDGSRSFPRKNLSRARGAFLDFRLDPSLPERVLDMHFVYALDDPVDEVRQSVSLLRATYPKAVVHTFSSGGHFSAKELGSDRFPALLEVVTK